ncbi:two component transcriptional regulator, LuxR family [hydrothermal vent metagenome]|uniref:Two component transcriptional regulator, LuxR family n=1 Tax=hydrothermal vent metagenome TaxID=652676 RepID=A0A3B1BT44_9ZZZZ
MKILLIDDHPLFRAGIATILKTLTEQVQLLEASSCEEALELIPEQDDFDLLLLDLNLPGIDGLAGLQKLRHGTPSTPIVVLSASEDSNKIKEAIAQGAKGYIPKSAAGEVIISALRLVLSGGIYLPMAVFNEDNGNYASEKIVNSKGEKLTKRQHDVLLLLARGKTNKAIAIALKMAENTVRVHVAAILKFLDVNNRTEAAYSAKRLGLL